MFDFIVKLRFLSQETHVYMSTNPVDFSFSFVFGRINGIGNVIVEVSNMALCSSSGQVPV